MDEINMRAHYEQLIRVDNNGRLLKEIQVDPQIVFSEDENGWTLLMFAAYQGSYYCVQTLLEQGADVNKQNRNGETALRIVVIYRKMEMAQMLLERGAAATSRKLLNISRSAFEIAMGNDRKQEWFRLFETYKSQFDERDLALYHQVRLSMLFCKSK